MHGSCKYLPTYLPYENSYSYSTTTMTYEYGYGTSTTGYYYLLLEYGTSVNFRFAAFTVYTFIRCNFPSCRTFHRYFIVILTVRHRIIIVKNIKIINYKELYSYWYRR